MQLSFQKELSKAIENENVNLDAEEFVSHNEKLFHFGRCFQDIVAGRSNCSEEKNRADSAMSQRGMCGVWAG